MPPKKLPKTRPDGAVHDDFVRPQVDPVAAIELPQAVEKDPLKRDFKNFVWLVWRHLGLPDPTPLQYDICDYLQHGPKRSIIEAFRGVGKSWITSAFVCWLLYCDPQIKILVVSASKGRADDFTTFVMKLIKEMPILQHLAPGEDQRDSKISFDVAPARPDHAPSVKSVGITGQIAGSRADVIIPDDVEVPNNSATQMMRDKLAESVKEFDAVLKANRSARILFLGTPQTEMSLYNVLPTRGYSIRVWPARYPNPKQRDEYGTTLAPYITEALDRDPKLAGQPTDPKRFGEEELLEREASYGRSGFALQFMLSTRLSDADRYPLRLSDLIVMSLSTDRAPVELSWGNGTDLILNEVPNVGFSGDRYYRPSWVARDSSGQPDMTVYTGSVLAIDPSGRGKDECAYAVLKMLHGRLFLLASGGFMHGYSEDTLNALALVGIRHRVNRILFEANFGDGMFGNLLKPVVTQQCEKNGLPSGITIEEVKHSVQKEKRIIDTLEPVLNQHRLVVAEDVIKTDFKSTQHLPNEQALSYQLFYQLTRITREKGALVRDDRLDALAIGVNYWVDHMSRDTQKAAKDSRAQALDRELERFLNHAMGRKPSQGDLLGRGMVGRHILR